MQWKFYAGACFLTGCLLLPIAPTESVIGGMVIAGIVQLGWSWMSKPRERE